VIDKTGSCTVKKIITIITSCFVLIANAQAVNKQTLTNQLKNHGSPYLAMHGDDPVQWQEWNEQTIKTAQQQNKLLFVSSGYFSCHWCHVMQRESYSNSQIAALLNKNFIPVKVDRELNASLDSRLIDFVEKTRGYAGWPLNVFITPQGHPVVGMVYVPPVDFQGVLQSINNEWQSRSDELKVIAAQASKELSENSKAEKIIVTKDFRSKLAKKLIQETFALADDMQGGFGEQNKFPSVPQLDVLLDLYAKNKNQRLGNFLQLTLNMMASQGLRDQLGGGFYRYVVDPGWQIPHFEKMLYDNALLASLYLKAAKVFNRQDYEQIGRETLDFMLEEMKSSDAFIASMSAIDDQDIEGGYYLWTEEELQKLLSKNETKVVQELWQITGPADIEHGHHLITATSLDDIAKQNNWSYAQAESLLNSARSKMLKHRQTRLLPLDEKKIASWNGLVLSALVAGAKLQTNNQKYYEAAAKLESYIHNNFWDGKHLYRAVGKQAFGDAGLEDAAYLSKGLLDWASLTDNKTDYQKAMKLAEKSWQWFFTDEGWKLNRNALLKYKETEPAIAEGPLPSPSAVLIQASLELAAQTGHRALEVQARQSTALSAGIVLKQPFWHATYVKLYE
jgi:uncharacterized protein YyaL (SSP411 family)